MVNFIEFPIFDGVSGDLRQWILWLEDFFVRERFTADEKMNLAQSLLEGEANAWFYNIRKRFIFQSWEDLKYNLWLRFGDFADYDRLFQELRVEKRRKRMLRKAITPHESISSPATIHEPVPVNKFSNQQVDEISGEKKDESHEATLVKVSDSLEEESIHQNQVPVSQLEPSLQITKESPNVCENSQAVVGCEHQRSIQKNIRMDVVNGDVERIQRVMSITTNVSAHHVFDELLLRQHKFQQRKKPSLSPKSRMFKFQNKTLLSNWSQMDLHQVIDISNVTNSYPCLSADFGLVRKKRTFQCLRLRNLRLHKQAHMSRFLNPLRMLHDPGGMKQLLHGDMKSWFVCERESRKRFRDMAVQPTRQVGLDTIALQLDQRDITLVGWKVAIASLLEVICAWAECMMHTTIVISAKLYSPFSCEVDTNENMSSGLSQTSQVWEPGGVIAAYVLVDWLVDFNGYGGIVDGIRRLAIDSRRASRVWERGGLDISTFVSFNLQSYSSWCGWLVFDRGKNNKWDAHVDSLISSMLPSYAQDIMKRQADKKRRNVEFSVGDWVYIKLQPYRQLSVMHRIHQKLAAKFFDFFLVIALIGMVASKLEDCISLYPISKLEDKLVFEGASIDTTQQDYYRKKKKNLVVEGLDDVATA